MRVVAYLLIAANIVYLAWAGWIDVPPPPPARTGDALPQLVLASEDIEPGDSASKSTPSTRMAAAAVLSTPQTGAISPGRCVSVGPFNELTQAARAAALLRERGFEPRQRAEPGETWSGFWVHVDDLDTAAEVSELIKALENAGIRDAQAMPGGERRVSVGLFTERARAERRAQAVTRLGYTPEITERQQAGTVYWVDLDVDSPERSVPTEGLLSVDGPGSRLEVRVCPTPAGSQDLEERLPGDVRPAATTADAGPRPG